MNEPYKIIFDFLRTFEPEVAGRSVEPVSAEMRAKMRSFAAGKLGAEELQELQKALDQNPSWISALATEVKGLRRTSKAPDTAKSED